MRRTVEIKATLVDSALLRQGLTTHLTHPATLVVNFIHARSISPLCAVYAGSRSESSAQLLKHHALRCPAGSSHMPILAIRLRLITRTERVSAIKNLSCLTISCHCSRSQQRPYASERGFDIHLGFLWASSRGGLDFLQDDEQV